MLASFFAAVDRHPLTAWLIGTLSTLASWLQLHRGELSAWFELATGFFGAISGAVTVTLMICSGVRWLRAQLSAARE
ncbi:MAG TPA: hypothetical protein VF614_01375 [Chthoniobacteraceae bacterium]|jgi:hypothetical protein